MAASTSSTSSPPPANHQYDYDVFLSFRGEDTRNNFVSHLFAAFDRKGFRSFRDDHKHLRGRDLSPALVEAICSSRVAVVLLSQDYASSTWCLEELVKILECKQKLRKMVLPIFYNVNPSQLRKLTGKFGEAMAQHDQRFADNKEKVQSWRAALYEVSCLSGWDSNGRPESTLIEEIEDFISKELMNCVYRSDARDLFGMDSRLQKLHSLLCVGWDDVRFVGICGMGGMGKTTLAEVIYNQISCQFDACCFLANIKEQNLVHLQEKLLSKVFMGERVNLDTASFGANVIKYRLPSRKTLIVLDDVDHLEQLEALAGKHDWFGSGSRVIITTRDEHLLVAHNVDNIYKAAELEMQHAFQLFCWKAFRVERPPSDYVGLANSLIDYAKGQPLALRVLGSSVCGKSIVEWGSALNKLRTCPNEEIQKTLRLSYDGLDDAQKNLFLDVACFFNGYDKGYMIKFLEGKEFDFSVLVRKSLLTTKYNTVLMHDLLQEMGRDIVHQESPKEPGRRSRLWLKEDVCHVLTRKSGTEEVQGIVLNLDELTEVTNCSSQAFARMSNLRLLKIYSKELESCSGFPPTVNNIELHKILHLAGGLKLVSNELKCLYWHGLKSLPTGFHPHNLVELNMSYSPMKRPWKGNMLFPKLKILNLSYSQNLTKTPNFSGFPNLERLDLSGCLKLEKFPDILGNMPRLLELFLDTTSIKELPPSINNLSGLVSLVLDECENLESLPQNVCMLPSLRKLSLNGCSNLEKLPEDLGNLASLEKLYANRSAITQVPPSIAQLKNLAVLSFRGCKQRRPKSRRRVFSSFQSPSKHHLSMSLDLSLISKMYSLTYLYLSGCDLSAIPDDFGRLTCLRHLDLSHNNFISIPSTLAQLANLRSLIFEGCGNLKELPTLAQLSHLRTLDLEGCQRLMELPTLPQAGAIRLVVDGCTSLQRLRAVNSMEARFPNCYKLLENQGMDDLFEKLLLSQVQRLNGRRSFVDAVIPGREIPKWLDQQSMGDSVSIQLQPDWHDSANGIVVCAVFRSSDGSRPYLCSFGWGGSPMACLYET